MAEARHPHAPEDSPPEVIVAEAWAEFAKALSIYPETNQRVKDAQDRLQKALTSAVVAGGRTEPSLQILFLADEVQAGETRVEIREGTPLAWLHERVHRALLAGITIRAGVPRESLAGLTHRLHELFGRTTLDEQFEALWPETYEGLDLHPRRFDGSFDGAARDVVAHRAGARDGPGRSLNLESQQRLVGVLSEDGGVAKDIARLEAALEASAGGDADRESADLIGRIVKVLPTDALEQYDTAVKLTRSVLGTLTARLGTGTAQSGLATAPDDALLHKLMFITSHGLFGREGVSAEDVADGLEQQRLVSSVPEVDGLPDPAPPDDVDALLSEIERLPIPSGIAITGVKDVESAPEMLGATLHQLVRLTSDDVALRADPAIAGALESEEPEALAVLATYLEAARADPAPGAPPLAWGRVDQALERLGLRHLLRRCGVVNAESVARRFPRDFVEFLDTVDLDVADERAALADLCRVLGPARILEAAGPLTATYGLMEAGRVERILATGDPAVMPLAHVILDRGGGDYKPPIAAYLRRLRLEADEACVLDVAREFRYLPRAYLLALLDPAEDGTYPESLGREVSSLLCAFIRETADQPERTERRAYAVRRLIAFPSAEATAMLEQILGEKKLFLLPKEPVEVREAARAVLDAYERRRKGGAS